MSDAKLYARLLARSVRVGECLLWTGGRLPGGYGSISVNGKTMTTHAAMMRAVGRDVGGNTVDHRCHTNAVIIGTCRGGVCVHRRCIEPEHLEVCSGPENTRRAVKPACAAGHSRIGHNAYWNGRQWVCRVCQRGWQRNYQLRRKAAQS